MLDHALRPPEATENDIAALCEQARQLGVYAVCVSPTLVTTAAQQLPGQEIKVAAVAGFPSGAHSAGLKAQEAAIAAATGAADVDRVINLGLAKEGRWKDVEQEIAAVRGEIPSPTVLKVIIESAVLDDESLVTACQTGESAGADFVKTSTGFHPAGGATIAAVELMARTVGPRLGVKASGGVRTAADALAMVEAGATRLRLSRSAPTLAELPS